MSRYLIEPEVAGSLGDNTVGDFTHHPPIINKLHYQFEGWLGDDLIESFPCFLVSSNLRRALNLSLLTGFELESAEITVSEHYIDVCPKTTKPQFSWLKISGASCTDDFSLAEDGTLEVSELALNVLKKFNVKHADITLV